MDEHIVILPATTNPTLLQDILLSIARQQLKLPFLDKGNIVIEDITYASTYDPISSQLIIMKQWRLPGNLYGTYKFNERLLKLRAVLELSGYTLSKSADEKLI